MFHKYYIFSLSILIITSFIYFLYFSLSSKRDTSLVKTVHAATTPQVSYHGQIQGRFFNTDINDKDWTATSGTAPDFTQNFPVIVFNTNPQARAIISCPQAGKYNQNNRPITNLFSLANGTCTATVAQGNGKQAGSGVMQAFDLVLTGAINVSAAGDVKLDFYSDDGYIFSLGKSQGTNQQPTYVSGDRCAYDSTIYKGSGVKNDHCNPSKVNLNKGPFTGYPMIGMRNAIAPGDGTVTVHFPTAGIYPFETDYFETGDAQLNFDITANGLPLQPENTITGNVFIDSNRNGIKDSGETNYTGGITINTSGGTATTNPDGSYSISGLADGTYTISYPSLPAGYYMTYPKNGPPPSHIVTVGIGCTTNGAQGAACAATGNITNLNFGITNTHPWFQSSCGDIRNDNGIIDLLPAGQLANTTNTTCTTPGISFTGDTNAIYGNGHASASNQEVGGVFYSEVFSSKSAQTSYTSLLAKAQNANITPTNLASYCNLSNCTIPWNLPHGIYIANGDLTLSTSTYNVLNATNYIILVNGNLTLNGSIHVPAGSTLLFSTTKNIIVGSTVGLPANNPNPQLDGWYIAGQNFIVNSQGNCNDLRLGIAGTVVVNALGAGGTFQNNRDLCGNDAVDPTITFNPRLDLVLNAPQFLKQQQTISKEIAP